MGILDNDAVDDVKLFEERPELGIGEYVVEIQSQREGRSRKTKQAYLLTDAVVVEADGETSVGTEISVGIFENLQFESYHLRSLKELAGALTGEGTKVEKAGARLREIKTNPHAYKGRKIRVVVKANDKGRINAETGRPYTNTYFEPV